MNKVFDGAISAPWLTSGFASDVYDVLFDAGGEPRYIGGAVRDAIIGRPINDVDLATPLHPDAVMAALTRAGFDVLPTGIRHGTVTAFRNQEMVEITTLRTDLVTDGRHAEVAFTRDWEADAERRDFTMNALSCDKDGIVFDYFGGIDDLLAGRLKAVGDPEFRFQEDYLRILRYFRLAGIYGTGERDEATHAAAVKLRANLNQLSGERLTQEMMKILSGPAALHIIPEMVEDGILGAFLPSPLNAKRFHDVVAGEERFGLKADPIRRLAALLPRLTGYDTANRLRLSLRDRQRVISITSLRPDFPVGDPAELRKFIYRFGPESALDYLLIDQAQHRLIDTLGCFWAIAFWVRPAFPLAGRDLLAIGMEPGRQIGEMLRRIEAWWIDCDFALSKEACLDEADRLRAAACVVVR